MSELRKINRREFLKRTGQVSGGLIFALSFTASCSRQGPMPAVSAPAAIAPNVYVNVRNDGIVEIICHRSEMGQGIRTSLPQVIADEMEADWDRIELIQAIGDQKYGERGGDGTGNADYSRSCEVGCASRGMQGARACRAPRGKWTVRGLR
jgi:isoquinoline 1-oxidoreductase beta subunit